MVLMDYNYYNAGPQQPYQYLGFGDDASMLPPAVPGDTPGRHPDLDTGAYLSGTFNYAFDNPLVATGAGLTPAPLPTSTSTSPPTQNFLLPDSAARDTILDPDTDPRARRSSSEEKESLTPAQTRRKAQNRAAQRAFRERKERHVRELEAKLNLLTTTTSSLQSDNERLKLMLQRVQTENEVLRATASSSPSSNYQHLGFVEDVSQVPAAASSTPSTTLSSLSSSKRNRVTKRTSSRRESRSDDRHQTSLDAQRLAQGLLFSSNLSSITSTQPSPRGSQNSTLRRSKTPAKATGSGSGGGGGGGGGPRPGVGEDDSSPSSGSEVPAHLISASATWDLLQSHPLYLSGAVDIGEVCERLKKSARCEGMGPMFDEDDVRRIIEEVGRSGCDELI